MGQHRLSGAFAWVLLAFLTGCGGKSVYVIQHPQWEYDRYERLAVLPARAAVSGAERDAELVTDRLTTLLAGNGQFRVLSRGELQDVFKEQDLSLLADAIDEGTALPTGRVEVAQALVATRITDHVLIAEREQREIPVIRLDSRGRPLLDRAGRPIIDMRLVWVYTHGAEVEGSVRVVDAATGRILVSDTIRVAPRPRTSQDRPPRVSPEELAREAVRELAMAFYKRVAPTRTKISVDKDMLVVATGYFDGRYDKTDKIPARADDFLLVARDLPDACERNMFRVAIAPEGVRQNVFEQEFVWSASYGKEGQACRVRLSLLLETGQEKFVAKLYSVGDPQPIIERGFRIRRD